MEEHSDRYWKQKSLQYNIIVPTRTLIHTCLDVVRITYVQYIPKLFVTVFKQENP